MKIAYLFVFLFLAVACKQGQREVTPVGLEDIDLTDKESVLSELDTIGTGIPIFYNMYLSVELSSLFETAGAVFSKDILNPYDKISEFITSYKQAMNIGVYAVDLSYARAFEQYEVAGRYFSAMQQLSEQLGIPQDYFLETAERLERNLTDKDSLIVIANEVYYKTEEYLKENERFATASVIIMAGWVEAIYIGTNVAIESQNSEIIERLLEQKYSLNNLLIMLKDYEQNEAVSGYISKLKNLRNVFDKLDVEIPADYNVDSSEGKTLMSNWLKQVKTLQDEIVVIRKQIIE